MHMTRQVQQYRYVVFNIDVKYFEEFMSDWGPLFLIPDKRLLDLWKIWDAYLDELHCGSTCVIVSTESKPSFVICFFISCTDRSSDVTVLCILGWTKTYLRKATKWNLLFIDCFIWSYS